MLTSLSASNFRSFESVSIRDLKRVNIIVGRNASGKTTLLEAVKLATGATPNVAWALNQWRGFQTAMGQWPSKELFESVWLPYFFNFDSKKEISTRFSNSDGQEATLRMYFDAKRAVTPTIPPQFQGYPQITPATIVPVAFDRMHLDGRTSSLLATIQLQNGIVNLEQGQELGSGTEYFPANNQFNSTQAAQWFSQLSIANREREIKEAITADFPFITDLSIQAPSQLANVHATMSYMSQKVPLSLVSAGINKFFIIMTAIVFYRGGVVLIDEIENGLHVRILEQFWATMHRLAVANSTQIFLTTHSWECLKAAIPTIEKKSKGLFFDTDRTRQFEIDFPPFQWRRSRVGGRREL